MEFLQVLDRDEISKVDQEVMRRPFSSSPVHLERAEPLLSMAGMLNKVELDIAARLETSHLIIEKLENEHVLTFVTGL